MLSYPSFHTKGEAETFLRELKLRPINQITGYKPMVQASLAEAIQKYLAIVTVKKATRTQDTDRLALGSMSNFLKDKFLAEICLSDLETYQLHLLKDLNPASVNRKFNVIKNFLNKCVEWEFLRESPALRIRKLREITKYRDVPRAEVVQKLIDALPDWAANPLFFVAQTGARRGEACSLIWQNVNFDKRVIHIRSIKGGVERIRNVPMTKDLQGFFLRLWNLQAKSIKKSEFVFLNHDGERLRDSSLSRCVISLGKKIGIPNAGIQILRVYVVTRMAENNQNGSQIQRLVGHSNLSTTQKYLHHNDESLRVVMEEFSQHEIIRPKALSEGSGC